jgi:hypothetical protein
LSGAATTALFGALSVGVLVALGLSAWAVRLARASRRPGRPAAGHAAEVAPAGRSLQHVGVVRFNPYHDTGGDYSFAVALLDAGGDGVVLSGLYHRDRCRVYAKPVGAWSSAYTLTDEEVEAIDRARG